MDVGYFGSEIKSLRERDTNILISFSGQRPAPTNPIGKMSVCRLKILQILK